MTTKTKVGLLGIVLVAAVATGAVVFLSSPRSTSPLDLPIPTLPDLATIDAPIAEQFQTKHDRLLAALQAPSSEQNLSQAFGALGELFQIYQRLEDARVCYENAVKLHPESFRWQYLLGYVYHALGEGPASSQHLSKALALRDDYGPAMYRLGQNALDAGQLDEAEQWFERQLALSDNDASALYGQARVASMRGDFAVTIELLNRALDLQPDVYDLRYLLATTHRNMGDLAAAREVFDALPIAYDQRVALRVNDPVLQQVMNQKLGYRRYASQGLRAYNRGQYPLALQLFNQSLAVKPDSATALYNKALTLLKLGRAQQALEHLYDTIEQVPTHVAAHVLLANLLIGNGQWQDAESLIDAVLDMDPDHPTAHLVLIRMLLIQARFDQALPLLEKARQMPAIETQATLLMSRLLSTHPDEHIRNGPRALQMAESLNVHANTTLYETLAMAHAAAGDFAQASALQTQAKREAERQGKTVAMARIDQRLRDYAAGQVCRQPLVETEQLEPLRPQDG